MPRQDIWDVQSSENNKRGDCGYDSGLRDAYSLGDAIGKGGFGQVYECTQNATGHVFACKVIKKTLDLPGVSAARQQRHLANIQREVAVLKRLRGTLSVVQLEAVYEDNDAVYIVMEKCSGGELWRPRGQRDYSEQMAARCMRAVMRTLAQCHAAGILHRDVKPGNFLLLGNAPDAPIKAIDFGMAVFFKHAELPLTDLGLDGTAWFMAPELLSSEAYPASDVWAAGVMAYQLLSGYLPFDDQRNPDRPALSLVWKSILADAVSFKHSCWASVSQDAKDWITACLTRDHKQRPTAAAALQHRWLTTAHEDEARAAPLAAHVVARMQHFARRDALQRSILPLIANELLDRLQADAGSKAATRISAGGAVPATSPAASAASSGRPGSGSLADRSARAGAAPEAWRDRIRQRGAKHAADEVSSLPKLLASRSELLLAAAAMQEGSVRGRCRTHRGLSAGKRQADEQVKAARLALDSSGSMRHSCGRQRGPRRSRDGHATVADVSEAQRTRDAFGWQPPTGINAAGPAERPDTSSHQDLPNIQEDEAPAASYEESRNRGGTKALKQLSIAKERHGGAAARDGDEPPYGPAAAATLRELAPVDVDAEAVAAGKAGSPRPAFDSQTSNGSLRDGGKSLTRVSSASDVASPHTRLHCGGTVFRATAESVPSQPGSTLKNKVEAAQLTPTPDDATMIRSGSEQSVGRTVHSVQSRRCMHAASGNNAAVLSFLVRFVDSESCLGDMQALLESLKLCREGASLSAADFREALAELGVHLSPTEAQALLRYVSEYAGVTRSAFVASQLDWRKLQENHTAMWLECARDTFRALDSNGDGVLSSADLVRTLRDKLRDDDVDLAVEEAMVTSCAESCGMTFDHFVRVLRSDSCDLGARLYDSRYYGRPQRVENA